jgi:hypothetical protein
VWSVRADLQEVEARSRWQDTVKQGSNSDDRRDESLSAFFIDSVDVWLRAITPPKP